MNADNPENKKRRDDANGMLFQRIESLASYLYPTGKRVGRSWRVGSLDINLKTGMWGDWKGDTNHMSRNLVNLWIYANNNCDFKTAIDGINGWIGLPPTEWSPRPVEPSKEQAKEKKLVLPLLEMPTLSELRVLSEMRSIRIEALLIARQRGFLWVYTDRIEHARAWLITDTARKSAIARRLDGLPWKRIGGKKTKTLSGSLAHWPIGISEAQCFPAIALVEGSPDFLALLAHAWNETIESHVAPVCMAGAGMTIPDAALPFFSGKRVRIFIHMDDAGRRASLRWAKQLLGAGANVDGYDFSGMVQCDGQPVNDLNDMLRISPDSWEEHRQDVYELLDFVWEK